ncbi:S41 family peptidase [Patescibacteria group bacterium]
MTQTNFSSTKKIPKTFTVLIIVIFILLAFIMGMFLGRQQAVREAVPEGEGKVLSKGDISQTLAEDVDFRQFWQVWNLVKETYYQQPVSDKSLYYGAVKGMVQATEDPYTVFFDPEEASAFQENLEGSFEGIGAEIGIKEEQLQIVAPLPDTPAEKAGLKPGDRIVFIDGKETLNMSIEEAVTNIRGEKGTTVTLGVTRDGLQELMDVPIIRDKIVIKSVKHEIEDNNLATISIYTFNHDTNRLFNEAINEVLAENVDGVILDLRSNPGGLLTSAIDVASAWVGYDTVMVEKQNNQSRGFKGVSAPRLEGIKTVVLVNGGSASGSEIVAGALQDHELATIVGTQTFGKGSVQDYQRLSDGSAIKVTIAEWFTPLDRSINESGITPDIEIDLTLEDFNEKRDPQKEKAIEILTQ